MNPTTSKQGLIGDILRAERSVGFPDETSFCMRDLQILGPKIS